MKVMSNDYARRAAPAAELLPATNGQAGQDGHAPLLKPIGAAVTSVGLARRPADARALAESFPARGVGAVDITIVDNDGIARVKTVPVTGLEHATRLGVGLSPVYGVATVGESFTSSASVGGPTGDLRLMPVIPAALGPVLYDAFTAVRAAEAETFHGQDPGTIAAAHRWLY